MTGIGDTSAPISDLHPAYEGAPRASDTLLRHIRALIFTGQLAPGQKLPPEREMAAQLGTSRMTVRMALRQLETLGFVVTKVGSAGGSWIADENCLESRWRDWALAHRDELSDMLEFRQLVERQIAVTAAEKCSPAELDRLRALVGQGGKDESAIRLWHYEFHRLLAEMARNRYLDRAFSTISSELFVPLLRLPTEEARRGFCRRHEKIADAIGSKDLTRLEDAMREHFELSRRVFSLEEAPSDAGS
jgi:DNA-binding FadR family transcriptional regulator